MSIFIEKSKTEVYLEGYWMHLSTLQSALCPIKFLGSMLKPQKLKNQKRNLFFGKFVIVNEALNQKIWINPLATRRYFTKQSQNK